MEIFSYWLLILGLLFWVFSENKLEDEMTKQQRLESLQLAIYFNYMIILFLSLIFYSLSYLMVLAFAQCSILLFFMIRMEYINYKNNRQLNTFAEGMIDEK